MKEFEFRFLDKRKVEILSRAFTAPDDLAALQEAEKLSATHAIEVWRDGFLVALVDRRLPSKVAKSAQSL